MPQVNDFSWFSMLLFFTLLLLASWIKFWSLLDLKSFYGSVKVTSPNMTFLL